jgi:hypothetical protein
VPRGGTPNVVISATARVEVTWACSEAEQLLVYVVDYCACYERLALGVPTE